VRKDRLRPRAKQGTFNPEQRRLEKQAARDKDDEDLRTGKVTREELQKRNSLFGAIDLSQAKVVFPQRKKKP
jgi:hypothetical protein